MKTKIYDDILTSLKKINLKCNADFTVEIPNIADHGDFSSNVALINTKILKINPRDLAQIIADSQGKELKYEMVDFHSSRPGHDLRYSLSGEKMKNLGWTPSIKLTQRIKQVVEWSLKNENWIEL